MLSSTLAIINVFHKIWDNNNNLFLPCKNCLLFIILRITIAFVFDFSTLLHDVIEKNAEKDGGKQATKKPTFVGLDFIWCARTDSNRGPSD